VARDAGLVDPGQVDDLADLPLPAAQRLDDAAAGGVGERLEGMQLHERAYA
jgi:hypothetical protein